MLIYFLCLFVVTIAALIAQRTGNGRDSIRFFGLVAFSAMVLTAGLRASSVGTDTGSYTRAFTQQGTYVDLWKGIGDEPGYFLLSTIAHFFSDQYWALLTTVAIVVVFSHMQSIYRFSVNPAIALFVFITMGYYTFFFNGARQGIACAIYTLAFGALLDGNFKKYASWVFLAFLFHKSAIVALPLYFLFRQETTLKYVLFIVTVGVGSLYFFDTILHLGTLISDKYTIYQNIQATGGRFLTLYYVLLGIFFLLLRSRISECDRRIYDCFLNMLILGATVYIVVTFSGAYVELTRIAFYFQVASIFLWPIAFKNIYTISEKQLLSFSFVCGHLVYFYIFMNKMAGLVPYQFNENIVRFF